MIGECEKEGESFISLHVALPKEQLIQGEDTSAPIDPHLWFSPDLWIQCGHLLSQKFSEFLPQNQESFASNFLQFKQSVKELDHWGKALVGGLPETSRTLITSHDAFRYFGRHFDIRVVALQGINTIARPDWQTEQTWLISSASTIPRLYLWKAA